MPLKQIIVYEDHVIFTNVYHYHLVDHSSKMVTDIKFYITPYGYFLPTSVCSFTILNYLKNPTETNKDLLKGTSHSFYMVDINGNISYNTISENTNWKVIPRLVLSGKGVKAIHNSLEKSTENVGSLLFMSNSYKEFLDIYSANLDPNNFTIRIKISDIAKLLWTAGVTKSIMNCEITHRVFEST